MIISILLLIVGGALVLFGADRLTDGATALARRFGVTEMVIGLTVVALGTSLPEFVTSFMSTLKGSSDISIGNIVGSNIFNTLVIVGASALVYPIVIRKSTVTKDIPFSVLASIMLIVVVFDVALDGAAMNILARTDGLLMLGFFSVFMAYTFFMARNTEELSTSNESNVPVKQMPYWKIFLFIILGLAGL
ncbi:MAG: sodium:calcium antiporter, partial [Paraprevotella sp.]|nr:sodium:calcium antiporter [Paraprevotella sp.]